MLTQITPVVPVTWLSSVIATRRGATQRVSARGDRVDPDDTCAEGTSVADISVMRLRAAVECDCGAELTSSEQAALTRSGGRALCLTCREAEAVASALVSRRALTELVATERGYALHRRRLPGTGTTIDHLFVGASGVFVIDAGYFPDAEVVIERSGGRFSPGTETLVVGGRRRNDLVDAVRQQCGDVTIGLADAGHGDVPVTPVLCFVEGHLPRRARQRRLGDVRLAGPTTLADEVGGEGVLDGDRRFAIAMSLVALLPATT